MNTKILTYFSLRFLRQQKRLIAIHSINIKRNRRPPPATNTINIVIEMGKSLPSSSSMTRIVILEFFETPLLVPIHTYSPLFADDTLDSVRFKERGASIVSFVSRTEPPGPTHCTRGGGDELTVQVSVMESPRFTSNGLVCVILTSGSTG